jgi:molecular chaperone DnaK
VPIAAIHDADSFVFQTEKALNEVGDKIDANEKASLEADLNDLKSFLESTKDTELSESQVSELKSKQEALMTKAQNLFTKMYENMQQQGGAAGPDMSNMGGDAGQYTDNSGADDVVDGDYREV